MTLSGGETTIRNPIRVRDCEHAIHLRISLEALRAKNIEKASFFGDFLASPRRIFELKLFVCYVLGARAKINSTFLHLLGLVGRGGFLPLINRALGILSKQEVAGSCRCIFIFLGS